MKLGMRGRFAARVGAVDVTNVLVEGVDALAVGLPGGRPYVETAAHQC
jgi:hypothetical protein